MQQASNFKQQAQASNFTLILKKSLNYIDLDN